MTPYTETYNSLQHRQEHEAWNRRKFLKTLGIGAGAGLLLGENPLSVAASSPLMRLISDTPSDRVLVLIRLKGGNDGQNTVVPLYAYDTYRRLRPNIGWREDELLTLTDEYAMPKIMESLQPMWKEGQMKVISSVGYPDQNLSHFRSSDIWASANEVEMPGVTESGWLGRELEQRFSNFLDNPPAFPPAVQIGSYGNLTFNDDEGNSLAVTVSNPDELAEIAKLGTLYDITNPEPCYYGEQLTFVRKVANSTFRYATIIKEAYDKGKNNVEFPKEGSLSRQLALVSRLIQGGLQTRYYMVTQDGFDTHADQQEHHPRLMKEMADSVAAFFQDLQKTGHHERVLGATVSEFGRRPEQNDSRGTDHGASSVMLLFGAGLNGSGVLGEKSSWERFDEDNNLVSNTHFKTIYASLLEQWLCLDTQHTNRVIGSDAQRIALGTTCNLVSATQKVNPNVDLQFQVHSRGGQEWVLRFVLPQTSRVQIQVFDILGKPIQTLVDERMMPGAYHLTKSMPPLPKTALVFVLHTGIGRQTIKAI